MKSAKYVLPADVRLYAAIALALISSPRGFKPQSMHSA
jgi:hypothetical protein